MSQGKDKTFANFFPFSANIFITHQFFWKMLSSSSWQSGLPPQFARSKILYSDEFVKLTEEILDIRVVYFDEQSQQKKYSHRRIWGRAHDKPVYWAADFKRCLPGIDKYKRNDVIIDLEDGLLKGFTVSDVQGFLSIVRLFAPISTIIVDNLDFA